MSSAQTLPSLAAKGVTKTYRSGAVEVQALRGVDLELQEGERDPEDRP